MDTEGRFAEVSVLRRHVTYLDFYLLRDRRPSSSPTTAVLGQVLSVDSFLTCLYNVHGFSRW
jgi:hypothetical protein